MHTASAASFIQSLITASNSRQYDTGWVALPSQKSVSVARFFSRYVLDTLLVDG